MPTGSTSARVPSCTPLLPLTRPKEEDVMLPVLGLHPVHHELAQAVGQVGLH